SKVKVGERGHAYVVDAQGRLIEHPDISLVLRNTDMSKLAQVRAARAGSAGSPSETVQESENIEGRQVLTAYAPVAPLGWLVFVELPAGEAYAPLYSAFERLAYVLLAALVIAVLAGMFLARRMSCLVQALLAVQSVVRSKPCGPALRASAAAISANESQSRPATNWRCSPTNSMTWPAACRNRTPTWKRRLSSARMKWRRRAVNSSWPASISPN